MFKKQIEELKAKEEDMLKGIEICEADLKKMKVGLATTSKARKQLEKLQETCKEEVAEELIPEVADEQPDIPNE